MDSLLGGFASKLSGVHLTGSSPVLIVSSVAVIGISVDFLTRGGLISVDPVQEQVQREEIRSHDIQGGTKGLQAFDLTDKRLLVGSASNVFVGEVVEQTGSEPLPSSDPNGPANGIPDTPQTQFEVSVLQNIKGTLDNRVTLNQIGGYAEYVAIMGPKKGEWVRELNLFENDPLLEPGQTVLFVTNYDREKDYHYIVGQPYGDVRIESEAERKNIVEEFKEAKRNQVDLISERPTIDPADRPPPDSL